MTTRNTLEYPTLAHQPRYRVAAMQQLADQQIRFAPPASRQEQMVRAEKLYSELDPELHYPYEFVYFRITGFHVPAEFRPDGYPDLLLSGEDLRHDLWLVIDELMKSLPRTEPALPVAPPAEPVLTLEEISKRLNVSTKTISRWRQRGLVGQRILCNGRWQLGYPQSVVERFLQTHGDHVERSARFSQLTEVEKDDILRRAKRMARVGCSTLTEVSRRIARRLGRSPETVRYTIKNYDREHPEAALFPEVAGPLSDETKDVIYNSFRRGIGIDRLAERFRKTRGSIHRIINEVRAKALLAQPLEVIGNPSFDDPNAEAEIMAPMPNAEAYEMERRKLKVPADVPPEEAHLYQEPLLGKDQEAHLFRQMNFLKHQAAKLRAALDPRQALIQEIEAIEDLQRRAGAVKDRLIRCNLRLVRSIAKKHLDQQEHYHELVSDGNMSLIRAVDKFDYARGNKFSTYASWAIMKNYARSIPAERNHREHFQTGKEELFNFATDRRSNEQEQLTTQEQARNRVNELLEQLDPREQQIVRMRAGLDSYPEHVTLEEIGKQLGITKERVRQLHVRAMKHLETLARDQQGDK
ncbi:MAG: sigma-70 family RNA polymerase sigma factor [Planctomycetia bacterium]|nr:sigma-70 family RNA polymerase sigma factor [Planctomycetia bacterium]